MDTLLVSDSGMVIGGALSTAVVFFLFLLAIAWLVLPFFLMSRLWYIQQEIKKTREEMAALMGAGHGGLNVINANVAKVAQAVRALHPQPEYPPDEEEMEYHQPHR